VEGNCDDIEGGHKIWVEGNTRSIDFDDLYNKRDGLHNNTTTGAVRGRVHNIRGMRNQYLSGIETYNVSIHSVFLIVIE
jgi:hypothetical protein